MSRNSTERFSDRVDDYIKYRPHYPLEVLQFLQTNCGLKKDSLVVDVGSGTGISTELFLKNGNTTYAVEPNDRMREAAEDLLSNYPNFQSIRGTSEKTNLPSHMADFIIAAQAFHWFNPVSTRQEFQRLLKPNGYVVILFNDRLTTGSDFSIQYEGLLNEFGTDYATVKHRNITSVELHNFLGPYQEFHFSNHQDLDLAGLQGRLSSSSYVPKKEDPRFDLLMSKLKLIFAQCQQQGQVRMEYTTQLFCSQLLN